MSAVTALISLCLSGFVRDARRIDIKWKADYEL